jgi:hypothetical protein
VSAEDGISARYDYDAWKVFTLMALLERLLPKGVVVGRTDFELLLLLATSGAEAFLVFLPGRPGDPLVGGMSSLLADILRGAT